MEQGEKKIGKIKFKAAGFVQGKEVGVLEKESKSIQ